MVELTYLHWVYLIVIISVIVLMVCKREVIIPCIAGIFVIGFLFKNSVIGGTQAVFNSMMVAGSDLFDIMLVIALMIAMLKSLGSMNADKMMIAPAAKLIHRPAAAFWVLAAIMYIASTFFWPTPATALVGTILIPIAIHAGLKPIAACMAINLAGHGMALSGDLVLQGAPAITAKSAGVDIEPLLRTSGLFAVITGVVALTAAFIICRRDMGNTVTAQNTTEYDEIKGPKYAKIFAVCVPVIFLIIIIRMILGSVSQNLPGIVGGDATALLGGTAAIILVIATVVDCRGKALERIVEYLREGLMFAMKIFTPIIPIAGFFMLGSPEHAVSILGEGAPGILFELGNALAVSLPIGKLPLAIGIVIIGGITGLDGSGFSGLPLIGALAASLAIPAGLNVYVLAALGQVAAIWVGGGCLSAWAFGAVASAGVAGVSAADLVRKNFAPVLLGLLISVIVAVFML